MPRILTFLTLTFAFVLVGHAQPIHKGDVQSNQPPRDSVGIDTLDRGVARQSGDTTLKYKPLTNAEREIVMRAFTSTTPVSASDRQLATDICSKKCRQCFNGVECNPDCFKKQCTK